MHLVRTAEYLRDYVLRITFRDGETKDVDFSPYLDLGACFRPLKAPEAFRDFRVGTTVSWRTGADVSPDRLYEIGVPVRE